MKTIFICEKQKKEIKSFHFDEFVSIFQTYWKHSFNGNSHNFLNLEKASLFIFQKK